MANHIFRIYLGSQDLPTYGIGGQWKFVRGADETANLDFNISSNDLSGVDSPVDGDDLQLALEDVSTIGAGNVITRSYSNSFFRLKFNGATTGTVTMSWSYDAFTLNVSYTISGAITAASIKAEFDEAFSFVEIHEVDSGEEFIVEFRGDREGQAVAVPPEFPATITNDGTNATVTLEQLTFSGYVNSWTVEFTGSLADTLISDASVTDVSLVGFAGTITTTVDQEGIEDVPITADISVYVAAVAPVTGVNEIWTLDLSGATTGDFKVRVDFGMVYGETISAVDVATIDAVAVKAAIAEALNGVITFDDTFLTVTDVGGGLYECEFTGDFGDLALPYVPSITSDTTGESVTLTVTTTGVEEVVGVHQVTRIALSGVATNGGLQYDSSFNINYDNSNTDIASNWATIYSETVSVTGSPADEIIDIEHTEDYDDHALPTETLNTLVIAGLPTRIAIAKQDSPDSGNFTITQNAGTYQGDDYDSFVTASIAFDATYGAVAAALSSGAGGQFDWTGISGDGSPGDPWIIESVEHCDASATAYSFDLGKSSGIELVTLQAGSGVAMPTITSIEAVTTGNRVTGQLIEVRVTFSEAVEYANADAETFAMNLRLDSGDVVAAYQSGLGTDELIFSYSVQAEDLDEDGVEVLSPLELVSADLVSVATQQEADLTFEATTLNNVTVNAAVVPQVNGVVRSPFVNAIQSAIQSPFNPQE